MRASSSIGGSLDKRLLVTGVGFEAVFSRELVALRLFQVLADHFGDQLRKTHLRGPSELLPRLARVAEQAVHFRRTEIARVNGHDAAAFLVVAAFFLSFSLPADREPELLRRRVHKIAHAVLLARSDHEILGPLLLQHQPLRLDVVARVAPVAPRLEISQVQAVLDAQADAGQRPGDLAADESLAPDRRLVIEQDAVAGKKAVRLPVVYGDPVSVELRDAVRRARVERRFFRLGRLLGEPVELGGRRLVIPCLVLETQDPDRFEQTKRPDLVRLDLRGDVNEAARIGHVAVVQEETPVRFVRILIQMVDPGGVEKRRAPLDAVNDVPFVEQELRQIRAVLAGNSGDQSDFGLIHALSGKRDRRRLIPARAARHKGVGIIPRNPRFLREPLVKGVARAASGISPGVSGGYDILSYQGDRSMSSVKVAITIDRETLQRVDGLVSKNVFPNRSRAIQDAVAEKLARLERKRLASECAKLDPKFEKALAEEGLGLELDAWPEY